MYKISSALIIFCLSYQAFASEGQNIDSLLDMSLDELLNVSITTATKTEQPFLRTPAAVYVISEAEIRQSGAVSVPELLRMVPGMSVARINAHSWAISARLFNDYFANKLLVMIDGLSIYNTEFSGVFWEANEVMLEDIAQIEVVRGPGGAVWGANAVNGVINIITKSADKTKGNLVSIIGGTEDKRISIRHGGQLDEKGTVHYRVYGQSAKRDDQFSKYPNEDKRSQVGFRLDGKWDSQNRWKVQGDGYVGKINHVTPSLNNQPETIDQHGYNLLGRWEHEFSKGNQLSAQVYYNTYDYDFASFNMFNQSFDLEIQHQFSLSPAQQLVWGMGYRYTDSDLRDATDIEFRPAQRDLNLYSVFIQNELTVIPDFFTVTAGVKAEHNSYTGLEWQPSLRLQWLLSENSYTWLAASRAVQTPSRQDVDLFLQTELPPNLNPFPFPMPYGRQTGTGKENAKAEIVQTYEAGYRQRWNENLATDISVFRSDYSNLLSTMFSVVFDPELNANVGLSEYMFAGEGDTYGFEIDTNLIINETWRMRLGYTKHLSRIETVLKSFTRENRDTFSLLSHWSLTENTYLNLWFRYTDADNNGLSPIAGYTTADLRLGWKPMKGLELSITGQNLLDSHHPEAPSNFIKEAAEIERAVYGQIQWEF